MVKKARNPEITKANRRRKEEKRTRNKERWASDENYKKRQEERTKKIESYQPGSRFAKKEENELRNKRVKEEKKARTRITRMTRIRHLLPHGIYSCLR